ncbi:MAG: LPS export ABC transporter periplasmic protein LptC [wastewater metagenome]|nr:LPS export ABC transporter periplasmic protein LptC [Candidatus Loosdrechtia aerotolerans]
MNKKRYIFIGIPLACIICIIVSLVVSRPEEGKKNQEEQIIPEAQKQVKGIQGDNTPTQMIEGLSVPEYNEKGEQILTMRGKNTLLLNNNIFKITSPEIEVVDSNTTDTENEEQSVFITSDSGEMNSTTNEGYLSENVTVCLDAETQLNTDYLRYLPEKKTVYTDTFVTISGKGIIIRGQGCEIDLINKMMQIKRDAEMEMDGDKNNFCFLSGHATPEDETDPGKSPPDKTVIRSSGKLVFNRQLETNVMTFHDNVEVKSGDSTILSDTLTVYLNPETKKTEQAVAHGNVLISEGTRLAKGSSFTWDADTQTIILEDPYKAEFITENLNVDALKIIFHKDTGNIHIPTAGNLKTCMKKNTDKKNSPEKPEIPDTTLTISWEGKMNYLSETREAYFEESIEVREEDSILRSHYLKVTFKDSDYNVQTLKATENVHIVNKRNNLYSEAVGDQFAWNARNKITILRGHPFALLSEGEKRQILSPKILFYGNENKILCKGRGTLYEKAGEGLPHDGTGENDTKINWTNKMTYNDVSRKASFYGLAQARRDGHSLHGDQIDAYLNDDQKIHKIIATSNVYFSITGMTNKTLNGVEGLGVFLVWDLTQNVALLTGDPKAELRKENSRTFSEKVYFDMAEDRITWEGRPHWQLTSNDR